ncbi:MAG TPA: glycosyltransferase family 4 protein [Bacillota bacterium]|jgi:glycosyltransferase involved in cell wall biosynthesis|nr:glycosyltransferase family 4 protein [Bacillota bacterium]HOL10585.1 glycosyltransferase family 4 protein [Bacillota bacterium]HPO98287.1 glycosyltransferase family 4 protein [Bacillota bacterium]
MSKGNVGIATLMLVDPISYKIISPSRWIYAVELTKLLIELGYEVSWFQIGNGWKAELLPGVPLLGYLSPEHQFYTYPKASDDFYEKTQGVDWAIYFDLILAYPQVHERSIAVAHSINWDDPLFESSLPTEIDRKEWKRRLLIAINSPLKVVTPGSTLIHWATATWTGLQHQFEVIPEFVPTESEVDQQFRLADLKIDLNADSVNILFYGTLLPGSGISETLQAMEILLNDHSSVNFLINANGPETAVNFLKEWSTTHQRSFFSVKPFSDDVSKAIDIVLFPAKQHQELGMECLRQMAASKTIITGQNSGLTDYIIHDHNGLIINPSCHSILETVKMLIENRAECQRLGANAHATAQCFTLQNWKKRWQDLISRTII